MDTQADYWNDEAGPRWAAGQAQLDAVLSPYAEALRDAAHVSPGARLVDVGCGCGATTLMARECSPEAEILGLDLSDPMLAVARARAERAGADLHFLRADAARHPIEAGSVARILSRFGVMFFDEPSAAFAHMARWLAPEGRMVVVVWGTRADNPWMDEPLTVLAQHLPLPKPEPGAPGPFSLGSADRRRAVFRLAGLRVVEERSLSEPLTIAGDIAAVTRFYSERGPARALLEADEPTRKAALAALQGYVAARHDGARLRRPARAFRLTLAPA